MFENSQKISLLSLQVALLLKPLVNHFCPLKILLDSSRIFHTVNTHNLKESERIFQGQKRITKGFQTNATCNDKSENFQRWKYIPKALTLH